MTQSIFEENIEEHVARTGLETRTIKVYRSLLNKHRNGLPIQADRNTSDYMTRLSQDELEAEIGVQWDGTAKIYRPIRGWKPPLQRRILATARTLFQPPPEPRPGAAPAHLSFGWQPDGQLDARYSPKLLAALALRTEKDVAHFYTAVADYLNDAKVPTANSGKWDASLVRDWAQNPFLAGYVRTFLDHNKRKRGPWEVRPGTHTPLLTLEAWLQVNDDFLLKRAEKPNGEGGIRFVKFRTDADHQAYKHWMHQIPRGE